MSKDKNRCNGWEAPAHDTTEDVKVIILDVLQLCPGCLRRYQATIDSYVSDSDGISREFTMVGPSGWS